jgi:hypothetical protein
MRTLLSRIRGLAPRSVITSERSRTAPGENRELVYHIRQVLELEGFSRLPERSQTEPTIIRIGSWGPIHPPCGKPTVFVEVRYPTLVQPCKAHTSRSIARFLVCSCLHCSHFTETVLDEEHFRDYGSRTIW